MNMPPLARAEFRQEIGYHQLYGGIPTQHSMAGTPHLPHAALAQQLLQPVTAEILGAAQFFLHALEARADERYPRGHKQRAKAITGQPVPRHYGVNNNMGRNQVCKWSHGGGKKSSRAAFPG